MNWMFVRSAALACGLLSATAHAETAYFSFVTASETRFGDWARFTIKPHEFVFGVSDPETIAQLRDIVAGAPTESPRRHRITGQIEKGRHWYNAEWPYHLVPSTVRMSEGQDNETCDATPFEVEDNLHLLGQGFLPTNRWCPWSMRLVREVSIDPPPTVESH